MQITKRVLSLVLVLVLVLSMVPAAGAYEFIDERIAYAESYSDLKEALADDDVQAVIVGPAVTIVSDLTIPGEKEVDFYGDVIIPNGVTITISSASAVYFEANCTLNGSIALADNSWCYLYHGKLIGSGSITGSGFFGTYDGSTFVADSSTGTIVGSGELAFTSVSASISVSSSVYAFSCLIVTPIHFASITDFSIYDFVVLHPGGKDESHTVTIKKSMTLEELSLITEYQYTSAGETVDAWCPELIIENGGSLTIKGVFQTDAGQCQIKNGGKMILKGYSGLYGSGYDYEPTSTLTVWEGGQLVVDNYLYVDSGTKNAQLIVRGALTGTGEVSSEGETRICGTYTTTVNGRLWAPFLDTKVGAWYHSAVVYGVENGLFYGLGDGSIFGINDTMSRAQLVTVLYRMEGEPSVDGVTNPFRDVSNSKYYTDAVKWASKSGIVAGKTEATFDPNGNISRQDIASILYRYAQFKGMDVSASADLSSFADDENVSKYALTAMKWAVSEGLVSGSVKDGKLYLNPKNAATRAEVCSILYRFLTN